MYEIPFFSGKNIIELAVENESASDAGAIVVRVGGTPEWIQLTPREQTLPGIKGKSKRIATFTFSVDRTAPVKQTDEIKFVISSGVQGQWTKDIRISVSAPERFELLQNYPNPFNPSTVIGYTVPRESFVTLKVYNVLGEEVTTLVQSTQQAGAYSATWDAVGFPSGVYFYRLQANDFHEIRKMLLMK